MDKEEARFILRCYRSDGADVADADFAAALELAATDRELGEWLAEERARDAAFAEALAGVALPEGLHEEILAGFAASRGELPEADEFDLRMMVAMNGVETPRGLRDEIVMAMKQGQPNARPKVVRTGARPGWWRFALPLAAAAGVVLAFVLTLDQGRETRGIASGNVLPVSVTSLADEAIAQLQSPAFVHDLQSPDAKELFRFIRSNGRTCPEGCLPDGLEDVETLGCRLVELDGHPASIVCFKRAGQKVHLVVMRRDEVGGELPEGDEHLLEQHGDWAAAAWGDGGRALILLSPDSADELDGLF